MQKEREQFILDNKALAIQIQQMHLERDKNEIRRQDPRCQELEDLLTEFKAKSEVCRYAELTQVVEAQAARLFELEKRFTSLQFTPAHVERVEPVGGERVAVEEDPDLSASVRPATSAQALYHHTERSM
jgi:hypothetical protein